MLHRQKRILALLTGVILAFTWASGAVAQYAGYSLRSTQSSFVVSVGATWQMTVETADVGLNPIASGVPTISYASSNTGIATVSASGVVTGVSAGAVTITATSTIGSLKLYGQVLSSTYLLRDRWIKANSSTSAGTAETGQAWTAQGTSVAGILTNRLYFPTPVIDSPVVADSTVKDGLFTFKMSSPGFGAGHYLRYTDSNNYIRVFAYGSEIEVNGKSGGAALGLFYWNGLANPDDLVVVRLSGSNVQIQLNNDIIGSFTSTGYGALLGTKIGEGFWTSASSAVYGRFGEVAARSLDHTISTTVASMALDQPTATISADGILQLHASQLLSTGENLSRGRNTSNTGPLAAAITWSSSATSKATVSSSGVVRGVAAGTCTITATDGTHSATCALTVTAAAGFSTGLGYTHQPSGFTQQTDRDFSVWGPPGTPNAWLASQEHSSTNMNIVTDATAPKSPSNVLKMTYPAQTVPAGSTYSTGSLELPWPTTTDDSAYLCRWTKLDPAFQGHPSGANKTGEFFFNSGSGGIAALLTGMYCTSTTDPVYPAPNLNGGTDFRESVYFTPNLVRDGTVTRGTWAKIEVLGYCNTIAADGTPNFDGELHLWLNDRKVTQLKNVKFTDVTGAHVTSWKPSWLWGGQGGTINTTFYLWEDHEFVSTGKAAPREVLIDVGDTATTTVDGSGRHWNNLIGRTNGVVTGAVDSTNVTTGITATVTNAFFYHNEAGKTGTATGYPDTATKDVYDTLLSGDALGSVTLSSLSPTATYDIKLYSSEPVVSPAGTTKFTVTGSTAQSAVLNASYNINGTVTITGVHPDGSNKIRIDVAPDPGTSGATVGSLGVIDITIH